VIDTTSSGRRITDLVTGNRN